MSYEDPKLDAIRERFYAGELDEVEFRKKMHRAKAAHDTQVRKEQNGGFHTHTFIDGIMCSAETIELLQREHRYSLKKYQEHTPGGYISTEAYEEYRSEQEYYEGLDY